MTGTQAVQRLKIVAIEAIPLRVRFSRAFSFGTVDRTVSHNVILKFVTDRGIVGYGEACPVSAFSGETQESIVSLLDSRVRDLLLGADPLYREPLIRRLEQRLVGCPFTLAAIDMALWDIAGKALEVPVSTLLGGRFWDHIVVHGSVGWGSVDAMIETALEQLRLGYHCLKLYVGRDDLQRDLQRVRAIREAIGQEIDLIVDVNGLWDLGYCRRALPTLRELGVALLEQPLPAWNDVGLRSITREGGVDVAGDEAIYTHFDVARAGRLHTMDAVNLGISKMGGLLRARECAAVAQAMGLRVVVGSVLELDVATAAGLQFAAALSSLPYPSYLVGPLKYERGIASVPFAVREGKVAVPDGPGLGIDIDADSLAALDSRR